MTIDIAVLLSGSGTTLQNLIDMKAAGKLDVNIKLVVSSRADAAGLKRAEDAGIKTAIVESRIYRKDGKTNWEEMSKAIDDLCNRAEVDYIVLAGFMCFYHFEARYQNKVVNVHPAILPSFGGQGMYGIKVHEAVVRRGVKLTGCTVHFVDPNAYDEGPIIVQRAVPVYDTDSAEDVQQRVMSEERVALPEALSLIASGRVGVENGSVQIAPPSSQ